MKSWIIVTQAPPGSKHSPSVTSRSWRGRELIILEYIDKHFTRTALATIHRNRAVTCTIFTILLIFVSCQPKILKEQFETRVIQKLKYLDVSRSA